jgi:hypothetical protein
MSINVKDNKVTQKKGSQNNTKYTSSLEGGDNSPAKKRDVFNAAFVKEVAELLGFTERYVYYVLCGDRINEQVLATYITLAEGKSKLLKEVEKLIPFDIN